ncbi:Hypothetical protein R9X50_00097700 [Acrodontium crateriforme]|uniref:Periplasmic copper-binding protein NosD beta helix domain-containing protein n=1 Tax=Acrodontium crateriforme TaxID=150365 RepID=A0AAQ3LZ74_9PEZI|nr:Hypothetical protein R9X50_00097700 [Acrodontium crateriforme]
MKAQNLLVIALNCLGAIASDLRPRGDHHNDEICVTPGHSIQKAIDRARPWSTIIVEPGTYTEQLTINKDGLTLIGKKGAVLTPPATFKTNTCSGLAGPGTQAGICVTGTGVKLATFVTEHEKVLSVKKRVSHVTVQNFDVRNFGLNIAVVAAENTRILSNTLENGAAYGFLTDGSINTLVKDNVVSFSSGVGFIGICNDNEAGAEVAHNTISGYGVGLCIQTNGANLHDNYVFNCCVGAFIDPRVCGVEFYNNHIGPSNPACGDSAAGIIISGAVDSKVKNNLVEGQKAGGKAAGLVLTDDPCTELALSCLSNPTTAVAHGNIVEGNTLHDNDFDVYVQTTSTDNVVNWNHCLAAKALPATACS